MTLATPPQPAACLEAEALSKGFAGQTVLHRVSLALREGELMALLGPSGTGKTTLLKLLAGLWQPDAGDIRLDGRSVLGLKAEQRDMVLVFQHALLFPFLTVRRNVAFGLAVRRLPAAQIRRRVAEMLDQVQIGDLAERYPAELSGGQRQRAALARALVLRPRVLLLDEPFSNLDPSLREEMRHLVTTLHRRHGTTTLFVTHDQEEALAVAHRIALMLDGSILQVGPGDAFYTRPRTPRVAEFFGGVNLFRGDARGRELLTEWGALRLAPGSAHHGPRTATIRPEHLHFGNGHDPGNGDGTVHGVVTDAAFMGSRCEYRVAVGGATFKVVTLPTDLRPVGERVGLVFPPERIHVFEP